MKLPSLNVLKLMLPALALAFVACSSSGTPDGGTTGAQNTTAANNGGSTSSGGNSGGSTGSAGGTSGGGSSSGGSSGGTTGLPGLGTACTIDLDTDYPGYQGDPCATYNLACNPVPGQAYYGGTFAASTGVCTLPNETEGCASTVGCASTPAPYTCVVSSAGNECLQACAASTDCNDVLDSCQVFSGNVKYCAYNMCGPGSMAPNDQTNFYGPCTVVTTGDGYCIPYDFGSSDVPSAEGLCTPTGMAATNAACTTDRPDAGAPVFCVAGDLCITPLSATLATDQGLCLEACAATSIVDAGPIDPTDVDAGPVCDTGSACGAINIYFGICGTSCDPATNSNDAGANASCTTPESNCYFLLDLPDGGPNPDAGFCGP